MPSQVPAPGVKGAADPGCPILGCPVQQDALPIEEGWGSKMFHWLRGFEANTTVQKAVEWVLLIVSTVV